MPRVSALLVLRIATLIALAAATALAVEYRSIDSSFCGVESGCAALRRTDIAYLWGLGLSLPDLGLVAFSSVFALSLTRSARVTAPLAIAGAVVAVGLLAAQVFFLRQLCWLCVVVDIGATVAGAAGVAMLRAPPDAVQQQAPVRVWTWAALGALAVVAPAFWPLAKPAPPIPKAIRAHYEAGKINVVEFADFECPFCRELHHRLKGLLTPYGDRVRFVRLNMPLERHPHARDAARAAVCAEPSGKADALSEFLFTTEDLSLPTIRKHAATLGVSLGAFDACLTSSATQQRLEREASILRDVGFQGLPTTYIGDRQIVGAQPNETFQDALERAARGEGNRGIPVWAYLLVVAAIGVAIARSGR